MTKKDLSYRARLMQAASNLIYRFHWWILAGAVVFTGFMYWSGTHLSLKLNFTDMLSPTAPAVVEYKNAVARFGALSFLFVVLEVDRPEELDQAKAYADELARLLPADPAYVPRVFYKIEIDDYLDDALLFVPPKELELLAELSEKNRGPIAKLMAAPGLAASVEAVDEILRSYVKSGEVPELSDEGDEAGLVFDPLRELIKTFQDYAVNGPSGQADQLKSSFLASAFKARRDLPLDLSEAYILSKDKKRLLMFVSSTEPAEDFEWCRRFMEYVEGVNAKVARHHPGVKSFMTGNAAFMRDDNQIIREDMGVTTIVAFVAIMALFAFSFRNLSSILIVGLPLAGGIVWAWGAAYWIIGHLTPVTAVFGAILLGMGIDYGILILSRYTEERHQGRDIKSALDLTLTQVGVGIITGAMATAGAFFSMRLAQLRAGQEMGLLAGLGIVLFVIMMILGAGSLLVAWDRVKGAMKTTQKQWNPRIMRAIAGLVDRRALGVVVVLGAGLAGLGYFAPRYSFEYNYLNLEPAGVPSFELVHKIPEWFDIDVNFGLLISRSVEEDRKLAAALRADKATVSRVDAISDFIPAEQETKLEKISRLGRALEGIAPAAQDGTSVEGPPLSDAEYKRLMTALRSLRDTIGAPGRGLIGLFYVAELEGAEDGARALLADLDGLIKTLEAKGPRLNQNLGGLDRQTRRWVLDGWKRVKTMTATTGVTVETVRKKHPEMIDRFLGRDGSYMILVFPSITIWDENNLKAVANGLKKVAAENHTSAVGVAILFEEILRQIKSDLFRIAVVALIVVFVVLVISYREFWHTLLTLIPLAAGGVAMIGYMNLRGLRFNPVNAGMLPLLIGVGVDYGVYMVHRWIYEGKGLNSIRPAVESTGRAISLAALTTMIGFASIILCRWRGLAMMGQTMTVGIGFCLIAAIVFLPAILKLLETVKAKNKVKNK